MACRDAASAQKLNSAWSAKSWIQPNHNTGHATNQFLFENNRRWEFEFAIQRIRFLSCRIKQKWRKKAIIISVTTTPSQQ
jgi:DNA segregation ATPase FtsK/SpoIIIE-like protein